MNEFAEIESLDQCNIILFGPTGSGKSSLIKYPFLLTLKSTLFMALHGTMDPA
jgi:predicted GTPase